MTATNSTMPNAAQSAVERDQTYHAPCPFICVSEQIENQAVCFPYQYCLQDSLTAPVVLDQ
jgi:hypothetical protein